MSKKGFDGLMRRSCTSVLVGRAATRDGSILIARNEDNTTPAAPKSLRMVPAGERDGVELVSGANGFAITLPEGGLRYSAMPDVTPEEGLFEEAGVNAAHVAMSATESALANDRVLAFDPYVENGLAEDAMLTVVLPYVKTAREGVKRLGEIVAAHGSAESNGVLVRRPSGSVVYGNRHRPSLGCSAHSRRLRCRGRESALDPGSRFRKRLIHVFGGNSRIRRGACA